MIPLLIVKAYRLIPAGLRGLIPGHGSSSHLALAAMQNGMNGWTAIGRGLRYSADSGWGGPDWDWMP